MSDSTPPPYTGENESAWLRWLNRCRCIHPIQARAYLGRRSCARCGLLIGKPGD